MKKQDLIQYTFNSMHHALGHDRRHDRRPMWQQRMGTASEFCQALVTCGYMTEPQMQHAAKRYRLGNSRDGGVIFWQIDQHGIVHDGKIMHYRTDCHRDHDRKPSWVSYLLRKNGSLPSDFKPDHCLFGLHLLDNTETTVCVVEAEKTAVIMSEVKPDNLWLATGGKTELTVAKLTPLQGRRIILFPDTDDNGQTYSDWYDVAKAASDVFSHPVTVSSILEQHATQEQKAAKIDIADLIFQQNTNP